MGLRRRTERRDDRQETVKSNGAGADNPIVTRPGPGLWHGWTNTLSDGRASVTSAPLDQAHVANKMFPKVRSWIRLGAPVELLSPLSIARVLALVSFLTWPAMIGAAGLAAPVSGGLAALSLVTVILLMRVSSLTGWMNSTVAASSAISILVAIGCSSDPRRSFATSLVVLVLALFVGLFMRSKPLLVSLGGMVLAIALVARFTQDRAGFSSAIVVGLVGSLVALMTAAMARSSRLAGSMDADTGVPNARGLRSTLDAMTGPTLVATIRLSGVAGARDALGHDAGSELIRRAVEDLGQVVSSSARVGRGTDDEVVIVVPVGNDTEKTVRTTIGWAEVAIGGGTYLVGEIEVGLDVHVGLAIGDPAVDAINVGRDDGDEVVTTEAGHGSMGDALRHSALAARRAEQSGVAVRMWDGDPGTLTADDLALLGDLRSAPERGELWVAYQPQVRTPDGAVSSVEALLRWNHPTRGFVSPGQFIPLAERTGLIDRLTDWVLRESLDAQVRWREQGRDVSVSVNVSPLSLRRSDFSNRISSQLLSRALPAGCLTVEVTESNAFDVPQAVERLSPLRELGVKLAIDDFGTGYTSLAVLPELPLDEIKIDQQFVRDVLVNPTSDAIVRSMCDLAHRIGLIAVAEGAEDQAVADHLTVAGYDLIQGFVFAKPMAEADLLAWLDDRNVAPASAALSTAASDRGDQAGFGWSAGTEPRPVTNGVAFVGAGRLDPVPGSEPVADLSATPASPPPPPAASPTTPSAHTTPPVESTPTASWAALPPPLAADVVIRTPVASEPGP